MDIFRFISRCSDSILATFCPQMCRDFGWCLHSHDLHTHILSISVDLWKCLPLPYDLLGFWIFSCSVYGFCMDFGGCLWISTVSNESILILIWFALMLISTDLKGCLCIPVTCLGFCRSVFLISIGCSSSGNKTLRLSPYIPAKPWGTLPNHRA